jgi:bifunctional non-homologous end joining protein LigD
MPRQQIKLPKNRPNIALPIDEHEVELSDLQKMIWPQEKITKADLLQYYVDIAPFILPHVENRALVMKRYPHGYAGEFFFMKRMPSPKPQWLTTCDIQHASGNTVHFPVIQNLAALLWVVNLECIDINPWYARSDDVHRPDYLHFALDPMNDRTDFQKVREAAILLHRELDAWEMPNYAKTTGARGIHVYVPIIRRPLQEDVWAFAKSFAERVARLHPSLITSEYQIGSKSRVLVDYNQNTWGRTLPSAYSVRPYPLATVSAPVTWQELERGIQMEDFRLETMRRRLKQTGDLWKPLLQDGGRFDLEPLIKAA